jgi:tRNA A-37 threonylcarbamoyl transferase component Bud32
MTMNATAPCPECGKPLPAGSDVCPACLMAQAIASRTLDGESGPREVPPPPAPEEIAEKFPQFEILECLGRGGMGVVYKARQKSLNRLVAIKILAPEREREARFAGRFAKEAEMLAKLSHPHIVTIHDFGETGGLYYLVMEFINGVNLRDLLREGKMAPEQALAIVPPICDALQFAHDHGIVHRDIKPENILLDREGRVKIADFGIATLAGDAAERAGTPHYMAPEQSGGAKAIDHRADVYALGVVLYEMLTGERPTAIPVAPSRRVQIDVRLDEVVLRALEATPERRFQSVGEFHTLLTQAATGEAKPTRPGTWQGVDYRTKRSLLGWPLVHVSSGVDPVTGKRRVAKGWLAVGDVAHGFLAFGGLATGVFAFGGLAIGLVGYGGLAFGLVAFGGLALGLLLAIGGLAVGGIAVGGMAIGYLAHGGAAIGPHCYSPRAHDPAAVKFFQPWAKGLLANLGIWNTLVLILGFGINFGAVGWALSKSRKNSGSTSPPPASPGKEPTKEQQTSWTGKVLHFAPAILLIAAWLTTGLEKGAVLILSVLVVAMLVLHWVVPSMRRRGTIMALALLAGIGAYAMIFAFKSRSSPSTSWAAGQESPFTKETPPPAVTVDGLGGFATLGKALEAAPEKAVIRLGEGTYRGRVVVNKPVTIIGAGWEKTRIELEDSDSQPLQIPNVPAEATQSTLLIGTGGEVILEGLTISRIGSPPEGDILSPYSWASAVAIYQGSVVLRNCALTGSPGSLLSARNASVSMEGCLVAAAWHAGITLYDAQSVDIRRCVVRNCRYAGIVIGGRSRQVTVAGNHITGSAWHGIQYDQDCAPVITGNVIQHHAQNAIIAFGNTKGEITGNIIADNETAGITLRDNSHDQITRNLFIGNLRESIFLADKSSPQIRGNIFSGKGIHQQPVHGTIEYGSALVAQNVFWDMTRPWERWTEKGPVAFPLPEGNRIEDPGLGKDFALPAGSPLPGLGIGPETPPPSAANFPIQPEETAIVPDGDTRNAKGWKRPR